MSRKRHLLVVTVLAALGLAAVAIGQPADLETARKQYELKLKELGSDADADAEIALAKWCLRQGLEPEARSHALAAHKKNPDDLRAKYLVFALSGAAASDNAGGGTGATTPPTDVIPEDVLTRGEKKAVTISNEDVQKLFTQEGPEAIRGFREVQRILARRCGDARCHGGIGSGAKWIMALQGTTNDRMLAENFRIVSRYFDRENPENSPIITVPMKGEGSNHPEQVIRSKTDPAYTTLLNYIGKLRGKTQKPGFWDQSKPAPTETP